MTPATDPDTEAPTEPPEYDPFGPVAMTDPLPLYRELRDRYRAFPLPQYDAVALPRFADVWDASRNRVDFSIVEGPVSHRERLLAHNDGPPDRTPPDPMTSFSMLDPPRHTTLRGAIAPAFTPGAIRRTEADMRAQARSLLDDLVPRGRFDVVRDLAAPVATVATCAQLGLDDVDHARVTELVNAFARRGGTVPGISADGQVAMAELGAMVAAAVRAQLSSGAPTPVVAALAAVEVDGRHLTEIEIVTQLTTMVIGGVESLPKVMGGGARLLAAHPDQRAALVADPSGVPAAVEEILRLTVPLQFGTRTLIRDAEVAGERLRAGQRVILLYISANRDEREFSNPDRFDVGRRPERHLGFGTGVHFCIGAHAARLEGIVLLQELLARVPEWDVDESGIERLPSEFQIGDTAVPIELPPLG
ncbi:MAG: cytochrome P450 [Acidimicrobiia bacterium]|jgi:cytochrome P450